MVRLPAQMERFCASLRLRTLHTFKYMNTLIDILAALRSSDQQVTIIEEDTYDVPPPLLRELQHLAGPPPPPSPPTMFQHCQGSSAVINIAIYGNTVVEFPSVQVFSTSMEFRWTTLLCFLKDTASNRLC